MLQFLLLGLLCATVVVLFYRFSLSGRKGSLAGPKSYPLLGNVELVLKRNGDVKKISGQILVITSTNQFDLQIYWITFTNTRNSIPTSTKRGSDPSAFWC
jgi:hypothetical protein